MFDTTSPNTPTTFVQRMARHTMLIVCVALLVGMLGTAAVQGHDAPSDEVKVHFVPSVVTVRPVQATATNAHGELSTRGLLLATKVQTVFGPEEQVSAAVVLEPETSTLIAGPHFIEMEVTAYCPCTKCCGKNARGITASGKPVSYNDGKFVAADTKVLAFGKQLLIPGYAGAAVEVIDRGGAIKGNKLDVFFPTHQEALKWGRQKLKVLVVE